MLMKNSQCQDSALVIQPPSVGPSVGASVATTPRIAGIKACFLPWNNTKPVANTVGTIAPPTKPCTARQAIITFRFQAKPQAMLDTVNAAAETVNSQRVENARLRNADSGIITISAIR